MECPIYISNNNLNSSNESNSTNRSLDFCSDVGYELPNLLFTIIFIFVSILSANIDAFKRMVLVIWSIQLTGLVVFSMNASPLFYINYSFIPIGVGILFASIFTRGSFKWYSIGLIAVAVVDLIFAVLLEKHAREKCQFKYRGSFSVFFSGLGIWITVFQKLYALDEAQGGPTIEETIVQRVIRRLSGDAAEQQQNGEGMQMQPPRNLRMSDEEQQQEGDAGNSGVNLLNVSAQPPVTQKAEVRGFLDALGLNDLNLERDGIQMRSHLTVKGRILQNPDIVYADDKVVVPADDGVWKLSGKFLRTGNTSQWGLIRYGNAIEVTMREFQRSYYNMCKMNGVAIPEIPILIGSVGQRGLESFFEEGKQKGIDFLVVVYDLQIDMQGQLKCLERKYEIATQNITLKIANDCVNRGTATLENIVQKTNPKLGGTNYTIRHNQQFIDDAFGKTCLVIGIALSHSGSIDDVQRARGGVAASTSLSAVGYAANTGIDPMEFIGDHLPNNPHRSEILDLIPGIIASTLKKFEQNCKQFPSSMLLFLNGSSEGDFVLLKRFEVPLVLKKMTDIIGRKIPLTVIVPQRSNVARIYKTNPNPADKANRQNIQPGVVVDTGLVHPQINDFFLNSHTTIQGTARTPKYTILHNDNPNVGMDAIQHFTYYLCFGHEIVNSPSSLPSPVDVASAYAERGKKMYKAMAKSSQELKPEEIVQDWIYDTSEFFRNKRINA